MTSHRCHGVSKFQEFHCLFNSLFCPTQTKTHVRIIGPLGGNSSMTGGFPQSAVDSLTKSQLCEKLFSYHDVIVFCVYVRLLGLPRWLSGGCKIAINWRFSDKLIINWYNPTSEYAMLSLWEDQFSNNSSKETNGPRTHDFFRTLSVYGVNVICMLFNMMDVFVLLHFSQHDGCWWIGADLALPTLLMYTVPMMLH